MTNAQIKAAQIAQIKAVLKTSNNFTAKELTAAAKLTYQAMMTDAAERTPVQSMMVQNLLRLKQAAA